MKIRLLAFVVIILMVIPTLVYSNDKTEIISLYKGSKLIFDDEIGHEEHYYMTSKASQKVIEGDMRRRFCQVPKGVSSLEVVKNFEQAIKKKGGSIIHFSKQANRFTDKKTGERVWFMSKYFANARKRHNHYGYMQLVNYARHYVVGKVATDANDVFISVAASTIENKTYYTLVTVIVKPMDMNNVTLNVLNEGIAAKGKVAIYDIYFDTGKYSIKDNSTNALKTIANYLKTNSKKKFLIVGHTDSTGSFDKNIELSKNRAKAVIGELIQKHGVAESQLKAYGVGPAVPVSTNATDMGRARNRRVELVEQ